MKRKRRNMEEYSLEHTQQRMRERYGIEMTEAEYKSVHPDKAFKRLPLEDDGQQVCLMKWPKSPTGFLAFVWQGHLRTVLPPEHFTGFIA